MFITISTKKSFNNNDNSPLWIVLMDQSQLVMTIFGLIANIATSLTLIKNREVGVALTYSKATDSCHFNSNRIGQLGGTLTLY